MGAKSGSSFVAYCHEEQILRAQMSKMENALYMARMAINGCDFKTARKHIRLVEVGMIGIESQVDLVEEQWDKSIGRER